MPEFVKIASWHNAAEAEHAKAVLETNGIQAFVEGADLKTTLSHIGSAIGNVNVIVRSEEADRAFTLLEEYRSQEINTESTPWFCGTCEVEVDAGFDVCWSCGEPRETAEAEAPAVAHFATEPVGSDTTDPANAALPETASVNAANPYAPPMTKEVAERVDEEPSPTRQEEAEELVVQASNAAVFGGFIPILGTLYSIFLLLAAMRVSRTYSSKSKWLIVQTLGINFVVLMVWMVLLWVSLADPA